MYRLVLLHKCVVEESLHSIWTIEFSNVLSGPIIIVRYRRALDEIYRMVPLVGDWIFRYVAEALILSSTPCDEIFNDCPCSEISNQ